MKITRQEWQTALVCGLFGVMIALRATGDKADSHVLI